jgi:signal transduction histidine kinase
MAFIAAHVMMCKPLDPPQRLLLFSSLVLGELIGYSFESHCRTVRLRLNERDSYQESTVETYRRDNKQLKQIAQLKDNFVASLSHEMRTPLNGIVGFLELAKHCSTVEKSHTYVGSALSAAKILERLLDDTLNVTRLEQGRISLDVNAIAVPALSRRCIELVRPMAQAKSIELLVDMEEAVETASECFGDERRLTQVLLNLLSNAIKFTPVAGCVRLGVALHHDETGGLPSSVLPLVLTVSDNGIGIHASDLENVFLKYVKGTDASGGHGIDRHAGAGLGLSISKAIVELHQGTLTVQSTWGEGSTFRVRLDLPLALERSTSMSTNISDAQAMANAAAELHGSRILVADDVSMNRDVVSGMLETLGCIATTVEDGEAAVTAVREQSECGMPFHAVLMDVQMPVMNGLEASRAIRVLEGMPHLPIIAITGFASSDDRERCREAGMDGFLTKPLSIKSAANILQNHLRRAPKNDNGSGDSSSGVGGGGGGSRGGSGWQLSGATKDDAAGLHGLRKRTLPSSPCAFQPGASDEHTTLNSVPGVMAMAPPDGHREVDKDVFDPAEILQTIGDNRALLKNLLSNFSSTKMLLAADAAVEAADAKALGRVAHSLKGQLLYLCAHRAAGSAKALERAAKATRSTELDVEELMSSLRIELLKVDANRNAVLANILGAQGDCLAAAHP